MLTPLFLKILSFHLFRVNRLRLSFYPLWGKYGSNFFVESGTVKTDFPRLNPLPKGEEIFRKNKSGLIARFYF